MGLSVRQKAGQNGLSVESSCLTEPCFSLENGILTGKAEVVSEENICPLDVEISTPVYEVPIKREIVVTL